MTPKALLQIKVEPGQKQDDSQQRPLFLKATFFSDILVMEIFAEKFVIWSGNMPHIYANGLKVHQIVLGSQQRVNVDLETV